MASNKTDNLSLDIWAEMDYFKRAELNSNFNKLDDKVGFLQNKTDREIDIKYPPVPLIGAKGDGTDDSVKIQNILNAISTTFTKALIKFPYGTYKCNNGIVIPDNLDIEGIGKPILDFSSAPSNVKAIVRGGSNRKFSNFELKGNGYNGTTSIGLDITGDNHSFDSLDIKNFNVGIDIAHSNTYILGFEKIRFFDTATCLYADLVARNTTNAGEKIVFTKSVFCNSQLAVKSNSSVIDVFFSNCSFDYCNEFFILGRGIYYFENCHIENSLTNVARGWRANVDRCMTVNDGATVGFTNCLFNLYDIHRVVNEASTAGTVTYSNCRSYFLASDGTSKNFHSEHPVYIDISKTSVTIYSPFVSKNNYPSVIGASNTDKRQVQLNPTVSNDVTNCKLDVTFAGPTPERSWLRVFH